MTKEEFIEKAKEYNYTNEEIEEQLKFHEETGTPFDALPLIPTDYSR